MASSGQETEATTGSKRIKSNNLSDYSLIVVSLLLVLITIAYQHYNNIKKQKRRRELRLSQTKSNASLKEHTQEFKKEIIRVDDSIYVAIGYGLANCILIEGEDGCIVIDVMESDDAAVDVLEAFEEQVTTKPIKAIILTHFHVDHTYGFDAFKNKYPKAEVIAHDTFQFYYDEVVNVRTMATFERGYHQFGQHLDEEEFENSGIGPCLRFNGDSKVCFKVNPTTTFKRSLIINPVKGVQLELYHAPGETNDQIIAWWPEREVLFPADNIYKAFPNLYAIRGTRSRDTLLWMKAIDQMISLKPKILVPQHSRPVEGHEKIIDILTSYRDAIQFVHDQTVRYINKGLCPDEITQKVKLPPHLANHPYLQEYYGTVEWSVKGVYSSYMGWFSGISKELHALPPKAVSNNLIELGGGPKNVLQKAQKYFDTGEFQWTLQLCDALLDCDQFRDETKSLKASALRNLAAQEVSACGRNWYLTAAKKLEGLRISYSKQQMTHRVMNGDFEGLFKILNILIDADKTWDVQLMAHFQITDLTEDFALQIRRGILEIRKEKPLLEPDLKVTTTSHVWREVVCGKRSALMAYMKGDLICEPGITNLNTFISFFDLPKAE